MRELVESGISPAEAARTVLLSAAPVANDAAPTTADGLDIARHRLLAATQRYDAAAFDV